jgi:site-specific DNA recombinase
VKTYFAYSRVSTTKQGDGSSLQEQRSAITAYAQRHDLPIAAWYEEMETAAKQGRRTFNRMLADLRRQKVDGIIIHKIDRSARNLKDWANLNDLIDQGVEVHFAHESLDMLTRGGRLAADIQAVVAADFIRNLRDEVRKGIYGRLKQGFYPFRAPIGYLDRGKATGKAVDPLIGPLVREAFRRYATGAYTLDSLRRAMAGQGLANRNGSPLAKSYVAKVLQNPFYIGLIRLRRTGECFPGIHSPLIPTALFEQVQDVMTGRTFAREQTHRHLYRRLVRCEGCGRLLTGERQKGHVYYRCHNASCRGVSIREAQLVAATENLFALVSLSDEELGDLRDLLHAAEAGDLDREAQAKGEAALRIEQCTARLQRLTDALVDGVIDKIVFEERRLALLTERRRFEERLNAESPGLGTETLQKFELARTALLSPATLSPEQLRQSLDLVSSNFVVRGKELATTLRFPFDVIANWRISNKCAPCMDAVRTFPIEDLLHVSGEVPEVPQVLDFNATDGSWGRRSHPEHGRLSQARVPADMPTAESALPKAA